MAMQTKEKRYYYIIGSVQHTFWNNRSIEMPIFSHIQRMSKFYFLFSKFFPLCHSSLHRSTWEMWNRVCICKCVLIAVSMGVIWVPFRFGSTKIRLIHETCSHKLNTITFVLVCVYFCLFRFLLFFFFYRISNIWNIRINIHSHMIRHNAKVTVSGQQTFLYQSCPCTCSIIFCLSYGTHTGSIHIVGDVILWFLFVPFFSFFFFCNYILPLSMLKTLIAIGYWVIALTFFGENFRHTSIYINVFPYA